MANTQQEIASKPTRRRAKAQPAKIDPPDVVTAKPNGKRTPIPVSEIRFNVHRAHTSPGCQQATRIISRTGPRPGHEIAYLPWVRSFRVRHWATIDARPTETYVPEGEVTAWMTAEGVEL